MRKQVIFPSPPSKEVSPEPTVLLLHWLQGAERLLTAPKALEQKQLAQGWKEKSRSFYRKQQIIVNFRSDMRSTASALWVAQEGGQTKQEVRELRRPREREYSPNTGAHSTAMLWAHITVVKRMLVLELQWGIYTSNCFKDCSLCDFNKDLSFWGLQSANLWNWISIRH